jgi:DNA mismatch repair protein MutS
VALFSSSIELLQQLEVLLEQLSDIERIIGRMALNRAHINDYRALKNSLIIIPQIKELIHSKITCALGEILHDKLYNFWDLYNFLQASINDITTEGFIKPGFDFALDHARNLVTHGQEELMALEAREIQATGISSLKVGYNQVTGYYIEITALHKAKIPAHYQHVQTLAQRIRFTTPELKNLEIEIFKARNEIESLESEAFERVKQEVLRYLTPLRHSAQALAYLDGILGFARVAYYNHYQVPVFHDGHDIIINKGRHPVVEQTLGASFIPNNTQLTDQEYLIIITGPNMGGKSTYLRQVALICLMAQCGSLVPAQSAQLPIIDRIFTRIGAGDNLAQGKSTFLVEMEETATICTQATDRSLVILDEVGRGTSTFDGIALAQAIVEYIARVIRARCLFATHYHELTDMGEHHVAGIANYHMACQQSVHTMIFLYTLVRGVAPGSFGLEVARMAGMPNSILDRAQVLYKQLVQDQEVKQEGNSDKKLFKNIDRDSHDTVACSERVNRALTVYEQLQAVDINDLTPRAALELLWRLNIQKKIELDS